jgi:hypothetical protein
MVHIGGLENEFDKVPSANIVHHHIGGLENCGIININYKNKIVQMRDLLYKIRFCNFKVARGMFTIKLKIKGRTVFIASSLRTNGKFIT